jgi:WD40 repeat protein
MGCEFSSDGRYIITAARDADVRLWDVASGKRIRAYIDTISRSYPGFSGFSTIAFGANDSIIVGARGDYIIVWDTQRGTLVCKLTDSLSDRSAMVEVEKTLSTRNRATLFSFSIDWKGHWCRLWDISSGKLIRKFETGIFRSSAALSPDEQFIVTGCYDGITRIWDGSTGKKVFEFSEYSDPSWGVNWSQDGKYIFSGTNEGSLIMWKVPYSIY